VVLALRVLLALLGTAAVGIAASIFLLGAEQIAWMAERAYSALTGWQGPLSEPWPPTADSELRFYAAIWGAYGVVLLQAAANLRARARRVPWLTGIFFLGGVGRALSRLSVGAPHPFFQLLMAIELGLPLLLFLLWTVVQGREFSSS
jgi:hypothetical protein